MPVLPETYADAIVAAVVSLFALYGVYLHWRTQQIAAEVPLRVLNVLAHPTEAQRVVRDAAAAELAAAMLPGVEAAIKARLAEVAWGPELRKSIQGQLGQFLRWDKAEVDAVDGDLSALISGEVVEGLQEILASIEPESRVGQAGQRLLEKVLKSPTAAMRVAGWMQRLKGGIEAERGRQAATGSRHY